MADRFLGDGTDGGTWGLRSHPNGALLVYENGDFRHVYEDLGPISNAHFVGVPSLSRMRIRRVPHSAATSSPGDPGPSYALWKFNKQGGRPTDELVPSFDEEMPSDEGHRLVRRIIVNDSHHVEIVVTFDRNDNHHVHGMGRAIADTIRIYVDMPDLDKLLASGNPDDWLY